MPVPKNPDTKTSKGRGCKFPCIPFNDLRQGQVTALMSLSLYTFTWHSGRTKVYFNTVAKKVGSWTFSPKSGLHYYIKPAHS